MSHGKIMYVNMHNSLVSFYVADSSYAQYLQYSRLKRIIARKRFVADKLISKAQKHSRQVSKLYIFFL